MGESKLDALAVVELAMEREKAGNRFYTQAAETTRATDGQRMFRWLAQEELGHLKHLGAVHQSLLESSQWPYASSQSLAPPLSKQEFPFSEEALGEVRPDTRELEALRLGIKAEKEDIAFYSRTVAEAKDPGAKDMFTRLVAIEQGHLELLQEEYDWLRKSKSYFTIHRFTLPGQ